jgi:hypothetical protein
MRTYSSMSRELQRGPERLETVILVHRHVANETTITDTTDGRHLSEIEHMIPTQEAS